MKKIVLTTFCFAAATLSNNIFATPVAPAIQTVICKTQPAGIIFLDPESKTVMVDLKQLDGAASEVRVKDADGKTVVSKDVSKMRTDEVVELDLSKLEAGNYMVEVSTYSQTLKQEISL
ncbi:MAG: hypothetical protein RI894_1082 [Bacteroidota bacterium]|jgi:phosphoribosylformylglycinamidine (FGAM) synthase PurS component